LVEETKQTKGKPITAAAAAVVCVLYYIWSFSFSSIRCCGALALLKI
jgi:hypothetical protein